MYSRVNLCPAMVVLPKLKKSLFSGPLHGRRSMTALATESVVMILPSSRYHAFLLTPGRVPTFSASCCTARENKAEPVDLQLDAFSG